MSRREPPKKRTRFELGTGNVFADIGISEPDEALAKACLADMIGDAIEDLDLTQVRAGEILGIDQGTVSKLIHGRLDGFSQERLIRYLKILGHDIEIIVRRSGDSGRQGNLRVALVD